LLVLAGKSVRAFSALWPWKRSSWWVARSVLLSTVRAVPCSSTALHAVRRWRGRARTPGHAPCCALSPRIPRAALQSSPGSSWWLLKTTKEPITVP